MDNEGLNIAWILVTAALVMTMQVVFCFLESGLVRAKNSINVAIKNLADLENKAFVTSPLLLLQNRWGLG